MTPDTSIIEHREAETLPAAQTPMDLMAMLIRKGDAEANVATMRELMQLEREWKADRAREVYVEAMGAMQQQLPIVPKRRPVHDKTGRHMYDFAPLDDIKPRVDPIIFRHGFSYGFTVQVKDGQTYAVCIIRHKAGHSEESWFPMNAEKSGIMNNAQGMGSGNSYAKRYAFCNGFGIVCGGEDDDAASAEGISEEEVAEIEALLQEKQVDIEHFLNWLGAASVPAIPKSKYRQAVEELRNRRAPISPLQAIAARWAKVTALPKGTDPTQARLAFKEWAAGQLRCKLNTVDDLTPEDMQKLAIVLTDMEESRAN